jgi:hypothetical protein
MKYNDENISVDVEFRIPDDLDSWECRFEYTEVTVINEHLTEEMRNNLKKIGYELAYVEKKDNITVYGLRNPDRYYGFLEILDFYYSLKDYPEIILKELRECISIPFDIKLVVVNVEEIFQWIP